MKNENYINIQGWMINKLKLKGNELILYALIYGFSQDGESEYYGSQRYIAGAMSVSLPTAHSLINKLLEKKIIKKTKESHYTSVKETLTSVKETLTPAVKETLTNNNNTNNNNTNEGVFSKKTPTEPYLVKIEEDIHIAPQTYWRNKKRKGKGYPVTPRKKASRDVQVQPIIKYFKQQGEKSRGMYFMEGDEPRNKRVFSQTKDAYPRIRKNYKELIDWWFSPDENGKGNGEWANYEPEQLFSKRMIERFKNDKPKQPKLINI